MHDADGSDLIGQWVPAEAEGRRQALVEPIVSLAHEAATLALQHILPHLTSHPDSPVPAAEVAQVLQQVAGAPLLQRAMVAAGKADKVAICSDLADMEHGLHVLHQVLQTLLAAAGLMSNNSQVSKLPASVLRQLQYAEQRLHALQAAFSELKAMGPGIVFEWVESALVSAIKNGDWVSDLYCLMSCCFELDIRMYASMLGCCMTCTAGPAPCSSPLPSNEQIRTLVLTVSGALCPATENRSLELIRPQCVMAGDVCRCCWTA